MPLCVCPETYTIRTDWKLHTAWPWPEERLSPGFTAHLLHNSSVGPWPHGGCELLCCLLAVGCLEGAQEHLQIITSFSCSTKGQDMQNMMIFFTARWLNPFVSTTHSALDHVRLSNEAQGKNGKFENSSAKRNYMVTQLQDPCSHYHHGMDLNDQRLAKMILKLSKGNQLCLGCHCPRGLPELPLSLKQHLVTSCSC